MCEIAKDNQSLKADLSALKTLQPRQPCRWVQTSRAIAGPRQIQDIEQSEAIKSKSVSLFLCYLLTGTKDDARASKRVQRLLSVFGQDMVYAITYGQTKPPKHIILPFAIKSLTGNIKLIYTLNRLGHNVSYSQLEEIDTSLSLQKLSLSEGDVPLPASIHPGIFIDRLEETISGEGTSHRVNETAVQTKLVDLQPSKVLP